MNLFIYKFLANDKLKSGLGNKIKFEPEKEVQVRLCV